MFTSAERWLLELMADRARTALAAATVVVILEERRELHVAALSGEGVVSATVLPIEGSAIGAIYRAGQSVALERPLPEQAAWLTELGLQAEGALMQPLTIDDAPGGMIIALRQDRGFREQDLTALGAHGARLTRQLMAERNAEVERLRYGAQSRERERERWARELHDETVQGLGVLRMQLANARDSGDPTQIEVAIKEVSEGLQREITGIRHLITELRPAALDDLGLEAALDALARRAEAVYGLHVQTEVQLTPEHEHERLDAELETTVYRIMQEALNNVSRHAEASNASLSVSERDGTLVATVTDDGKGLPPEKIASNSHPAAYDARDQEGASPVPSGGYGLPGMRERAELVGGELDLESAPGQGTTLRLLVPLSGRPQGAALAAEQST
jgi:two-component system, NarL family, sensor histidine kinase DevS